MSNEPENSNTPAVRTWFVGEESPDSVPSTTPASTPATTTGDEFGNNPSSNPVPGAGDFQDDDALIAGKGLNPQGNTPNYQPQINLSDQADNHVLDQIIGTDSPAAAAQIAGDWEEAQPNTPADTTGLSGQSFTGEEKRPSAGYPTAHSDNSWDNPAQNYRPNPDPRASVLLEKQEHDLFPVEATSAQPVSRVSVLNQQAATSAQAAVSGRGNAALSGGQDFNQVNTAVGETAAQSDQLASATPVVSTSYAASTPATTSASAVANGGSEAKRIQANAAEASFSDAPLEDTATRRYGIIAAKPSPQPEAASPQWTNSTAQTPATQPLRTTAERPKTDQERQQDFEDTLFEGATVKPAVPSRMGAHLWSLLLTIILVPLSWYLVLDVATRMRNPDLSPWLNQTTMTVGIGAELVAAVVCAFAVVFVARFSSLGTFVTGILCASLGIPFVVVPALVHARIAGFLEALTAAGSQGRFYQALPANFAHHLEVSGSTGLLLLIGVALIGLGFVSHGARRKGRKDYLVKQKVQRAEKRASRKAQ